MTIGGLGSGLDFLYDENAADVQVKKTLRVSELEPNRDQPLKQFSDEAIQTLADSIQQYGMIQPILVRPLGLNYQIVAGERRWRACQMLGWSRIPALVWQKDDADAAALTLAENLHRSDLHYIEEAEGILRLIAQCGLSQNEAAALLAMSPSALCNKLRLLRLSPDCVRLLREHDLSERHARALLRLTNEEDRLKALQVIAARGYNVAQSEAYIEELLKLKQKTPPPRLPTYIVKDVRIFLNTIRHSLGLMQRAGVEADMQREDTDDGILLTIRIPKRAKEAG